MTWEKYRKDRRTFLKKENRTHKEILEFDKKYVNIIFRTNQKNKVKNG